MIDLKIRRIGVSVVVTWQHRGQRFRRKREYSSEANAANGMRVLERALGQAQRKLPEIHRWHRRGMLQSERRAEREAATGMEEGA